MASKRLPFIEGDTVIVPLTHGKVAFVDKEDFHLVKDIQWWYCANGYTYGWMPDGSKRTLHRLLLEPPGGMHVDHIDRDRLNNRRSNLRLATPAQNAANSKPRGKGSTYKGITFSKRCSRWISQIRVAGKMTYIGSFPTEIEAAKAYDAKARLVFGPFAYLNFGE